MYVTLMLRWDWLVASPNPRIRKLFTECDLDALGHRNGQKVWMLTGHAYGHTPIDFLSTLGLCGVMPDDIIRLVLNSEGPPSGDLQDLPL